MTINNLFPNVDKAKKIRKLKRRCIKRPPFDRGPSQTSASLSLIPHPHSDSPTWWGRMRRRRGASCSWFSLGSGLDFPCHVANEGLMAAVTVRHHIYHEKQSFAHQRNAEKSCRLECAKLRIFESIHLIFVVVSEFSRKFVDNFFKNDWVNILPQHIKEEPVSHLSLLDNNVNAFFLD